MIQPRGVMQTVAWLKIVVEAAASLGFLSRGVCFFRGGMHRQEGWIYVVKLLRAHGGCLGVRRL